MRDDVVAVNKANQESEGVAAGGNLQRVCLAVACIAVIAAIVFAALYAHSRVPSGTAAKVNDTYVEESSVADYANQYRINSGLTDDTTFGTALLRQNLNVSTFRQNCINQLAMNMLINQKAAELGIIPSDDEVEQQYEDTKNSLAFEDDSIMEETLVSKGMTVEGFKEQLKTNLAEQALYEKEVSHRDASEDETLSYAKSNKAGVELKQSYHIVFSGSDSWERAQKCYKHLKTSGKSMSVDEFSGFALSYSDDENAQSDGGAYVWNDDSTAGDDYLDTLNGLKKGHYSEPFTVDDADGGSTTQIVYCATDYTFPFEEKIDKLEYKDMPAALRSYMADQASDALWSTDCQAYLSNMLAAAKITYYPMPDDEPSYSVDFSGGVAGSDDEE